MLCCFFLWDLEVRGDKIADVDGDDSRIEKLSGEKMKGKSADTVHHKQWGEEVRRGP